jgi:diacylglycerol kinase (ATP)
MRLASDAAVDDGLLDLVVAGDIARLDLDRQVPRVYRGTHLGHPKLVRLTARAVRIQAAESLPMELEGEVFGAAPVTRSVEPGALLLAGRDRAT